MINENGRQNVNGSTIAKRKKNNRVDFHAFMRLTIEDTRFQKTLEALYIFSPGFWFE